MPEGDIPLKEFQRVLDTLSWSIKSRNPGYEWHYDPSDPQKFLSWSRGRWGPFAKEAEPPSGFFDHDTPDSTPPEENLPQSSTPKRLTKRHTVSPDFFTGPFSMRCASVERNLELNRYSADPMLRRELRYIQAYKYYEDNTIDLDNENSGYRPVYSAHEIEEWLGHCAQCECGDRPYRSYRELAFYEETSCKLNQVFRKCGYWFGCRCWAEMLHPKMPEGNIPLEEFQKALDSVRQHIKDHNPNYEWHYDPSDPQKFLTWSRSMWREPPDGFFD
ncbi:hypothetical protein ABW19_dt0210047 [Dactylella cylindrospora]|nr:hypothetical protein ABW19_dt0210047 [Dactylella cylindrospora]